MLQQTVLGPSVRKTDLFTVHLCRQPLTVPRFPKLPHQHKYVAVLSPGELAKKVCGEWLDYARLSDAPWDFSLFEHHSPRVSCSSLAPWHQEAWSALIPFLEHST